MNNNLKAIGKTDTEFRVANYIMLFGGRDLVGEYFTKNTEFESAYTKSGVLHIDFEHGLDPDRAGMKADEVLGYVDWKTVKVDDEGIFVERVLNRQARYMRAIETLIEEKCLGTSSQCITGASVRSDDGEIKRWPLMRDSLTFTPMEPRMISKNSLAAVAGLKSAFPDAKSLSKLDIGLQEAIDSCKNLKDVENLLREAGGFSRADATSLVSRVKAMEHGERVADESSKSISELILNRKILT